MLYECLLAQFFHVVAATPVCFFIIVLHTQKNKSVFSYLCILPVSFPMAFIFDFEHNKCDYFLRPFSLFRIKSTIYIYIFFFCGHIATTIKVSYHSDDVVIKKRREKYYLRSKMTEQHLRVKSVFTIKCNFQALKRQRKGHKRWCISYKSSGAI